MIHVHPTAKVHPMTKVGVSVFIGPGVIIEEDVVIGSYTAIGGMPEHARFYSDKEQSLTKGVLIRKGARIFEFVSIHAGTERPTEIGEEAAVHNHSHIAHDVRLGRKACVGGRATIGGHCEIMEGATVGGASAIHQHCVIGAYSFLSAAAYLKGHMPPGTMFIGMPARPAGNNDIGLGRAGLTPIACSEQFAAEYLRLKGESRL